MKVDKDDVTDFIIILSLIAGIFAIVFSLVTDLKMLDEKMELENEHPQKTTQVM